MLLLCLGREQLGKAEPHPSIHQSTWKRGGWTIDLMPLGEESPTAASLGIAGEGEGGAYATTSIHFSEVG